MASATKTRQPRLRASCDGCFLAKVKCSKAKPICSRCLACGIECRYSPSSRAGRPKSNTNDSAEYQPCQSMLDMQHFEENENMPYNASIHPPEHLFGLDTGWTTPPTNIDDFMGRNSSISRALGFSGAEDSPLTGHESLSAPPKLFASTMIWTPPTDLSCSPFSDTIATNHIPGDSSHTRAQSLDIPLASPLGWADVHSQDMVALNQLQTPDSMNSNFFPSPSTTPMMQHLIHRTSPKSGNPGSCTCFTACLQSLQALHNASTPEIPAFDMVLSLNRKAVEGCAAMLSCSRCMARPDNHTAAMLLATVMGKITSFYKNTSQRHFDDRLIGMSPANSTGVSLGVYQLNGEDGRWLELEILGRELRKLEEVYARFREVCADLSDDPEVSKAMIGYLGQNLGTTLDLVSHRKGGMTFT